MNLSLYFRSFTVNLVGCLLVSRLQIIPFDPGNLWGDGPDKELLCSLRNLRAMFAAMLQKTDDVQDPAFQVCRTTLDLQDQEQLRSMEARIVAKRLLPIHEKSWRARSHRRTLWKGNSFKKKGDLEVEPTFRTCCSWNIWNITGICLTGTTRLQTLCGCRPRVWVCNDIICMYIYTHT